MGQTLTRSAQWTRAGEVGMGKLELTPLNEAIISSTISFVEKFKNKHTAEAAVVFKTPLSWPTTLRPDDFSGSSDYLKRDDKIISAHVADDSKLPVMELKPIATSNKYNIEAYNFEELESILNRCKSKITEVRICLEANRDPAAKIFGDAFATIPDNMEDAQVLQFMDMIISQEAALLSPDRSESPIKIESVSRLNKTNLRLLILLQQFDLYLLQQSVKILSKKIRLTPEMVEKEVEVLKSFVGKDSKTCFLHKLDFTSDVISQFGCRTPLWRQFHGDICYLEVKPFDGPMFHVACNTAGVYRLKSLPVQVRDVEIDRVGEIYEDIGSLLKHESAFFEKMLNNEEFIRYVEQKVKKDMESKIKKTDVVAVSNKIPSIGSLEDLGKPLPPRHGIKSQKLQLPGINLKTSAETVVPGAYVKIKPFRLTSQVKSKSKTVAGLTYWQKLNNLMQHQGKVPSDEKIAIVPEQDAAYEDSSSAEESEEEEDDTDLMFRMAELTSTDMPSEYWQVQKLIKYVKAGNQTGTVIALIGLRDYNLTSEYSQRAIREMGGIELFINLLETDDIRCKIASLKILQEISSCVSLCRTILKLGGLQTMVSLLHEDNKQVTALAAQNIAHMAHFRQVRSLVRQYDGIQQLVKLLKMEKTRLTAPGGAAELQIEEVRSAALALWSLAISPKVRLAMRNAGIIPRLATLLHSANENVLVPVIGILQECLVEESYQVAARKEGMIPDLVKNLTSSNEELVRLAAQAIFRCAEDSEIRNLVRKHHGLLPLINLLTDEQRKNNKQLLAAVTGAIWKCSMSHANIKVMQEQSVVEILSTMLRDQPEEVLVNIVGALGESAQIPQNCQDIYRAGGIKQFIDLLTHTNQQLLINLCNALKNCAVDSQCISDIDRFDGVRLLWSLLKHRNQDVQAAAAAAICPCIQNIEDSGEIVRSFVGGLTLLVKLLKSDSEEVLASICAAIAIICKDEENLAVLTDNGMVPLLARLTTTKNPKLQQYLAEAIARCSNWGNNRVILGNEGAVAPLVEFLHGSDPILLRHTCSALNNLSEDPANCIIMHRSKSIDLLLKHVASSQDHILQEAAASCLGNIRHVGLLSYKLQSGMKKQNPYIIHPSN